MRSLSRRLRAERTRPKVIPRVDVYPAAGDGGRWQIGCDEVLVLWDVPTGLEAEQIVRDMLAERAPELLETLEFDSYPDAFFASAETEAVARALAAVIQAR
jgi:hypothetical protein